MEVQVRTDSEAKERFDFLAQVVDQGIITSIITGDSLRKIRDEGLWKAAGFESFEALVDKRWGWTKRYANQLIINAEVINSLPVNLRKLITSGAGQKELGKLPESLRLEVANTATAGGTKPASSKDIKKAAPKKLPPKPVKKSGPPPRKPTDAKPAVPTLQKDCTGCEIPEDIQPLWDRGGEAQELITYVNATLSAVEKRQGFGDPLWTTLDFSGTIAGLKQVKENLKEGKPFAICPTCGGKTPKNCKPCGGRGFVSEFFWHNCVEESVKKLRPIYVK